MREPGAVARIAGGMRQRDFTGLYCVLILTNAVAWTWAWAQFRDRPTLLGIALLAWVLGLRHALDADHIAAIDNVVRKLMQQGRPAATVGLWFSLGHSSIVVLVTLVAAAGAGAMQRLEPLRELGSLVGTVISAAFLMAIAIANLFVLRGIWRGISTVRRGGRIDDDALNVLLAGRGLLMRLFRPLFNMISAGWHMYPLGVLFGLGFDTATEVGLLGIAATQAAQGMAPWEAMVFPALFTAGMTLVDTTDSVLMVGAYGWALINPLRKLLYNLTITATSVLLALLIGGMEALDLIGSHLAMDGSFWQAIGTINDGAAGYGFAIIAVFVLCWLVSTIIYRLRVRDPAG